MRLLRTPQNPFSISTCEATTLSQRTMWLINVRILELEEFTDETEIRYAILSHRWEYEEVTFRHIHDLAKATTMKGFRKIEKTAELAIAHGYDYAWVDTCCIDKSSSADSASQSIRCTDGIKMPVFAMHISLMSRLQAVNLRNAGRFGTHTNVPKYLEAFLQISGLHVGGHHRS